MLLQMALFHCLFVAEKYSSVYIYCIFFMHSSVDGHFGDFHVLATVSCLAGNVGVQVDDHLFILRL